MKINYEKLKEKYWYYEDYDNCYKGVISSDCPAIIAILSVTITYKGLELDFHIKNHTHTQILYYTNNQNSNDNVELYNLWRFLVEKLDKDDIAYLVDNKYIDVEGDEYESN